MKDDQRAALGNKIFPVHSAKLSAALQTIGAELTPRDPVTNYQFYRIKNGRPEPIENRREIVYHHFVSAAPDEIKRLFDAWKEFDVDGFEAALEQASPELRAQLSYYLLQMFNRLFYNVELIRELRNKATPFRRIWTSGGSTEEGAFIDVPEKPSDELKEKIRHWGI